MSTGYLYSRRAPATAGEIGALLAQLTGDWRLLAYRYQERLEGVELARADADWGGAPARDPQALWPAGRVFCAAFELRWQLAEPDGYEVQLLAERGQDLPAAEWAREAFDAGPQQTLYLWGERQGDQASWTATRLPYAQAYPVAAPGEGPLAVLTGRAYAQDGIVRLTRLLGVEAVTAPAGVAPAGVAPAGVAPKGGG